jgi:hypothetical protein
LADEELQDRRFARNAGPDRRRAWWALWVSILALMVSAIALFKPEFRAWIFHLWEAAFGR